MSDSQPKRLMLMFTIGPVQSFIEAARKTEDSWMGSYILSYLVATAIDAVRSDGVELIYPAIGNQSPFDFWKARDFTIPSFPNLFLAIADGSVSINDLVQKAKNAESTVKSQFEQMAECVIDEAFKHDLPWRGTYVEEVFMRQIPDFFDVYWVITEKGDKNYANWYEQTAGNLTAIKNCRTFAQISEFGRKCLLDGTREILHLRPDESVRQTMKWWQDFAKENPQYCRQDEALCAISLTKRMARRHFLESESVFSQGFKNNRPTFPSTSEVATATFKEGLRKCPEALGIYAQFVAEVKKLKATNNAEADIPFIRPLPKIANLLGRNVDGEWLYEETWSESYLKRYFNIERTKEEDQVRECEVLRKRLIELVGEPNRYYAIIALDGDKMGDTIRQAKDKEAHMQLSGKLIKYTEDAHQIVEKDYLGKLTYAGGDDVLALTNLRDLLPILKGLHDQFPNLKTEGQASTVSAGVCIAHNKVPLGDALRWARRLESAAKHEGGRDALGLALFKHSGNISRTIVKWKYGELDVIGISQRLVKLLTNEEISKRFLYVFRETFAKLIESKDDFDKLSRPLVQTEFKRLMERAHADKTSPKEIDQQCVNDVVSLIPQILPFDHFLGYLEIVNFIARGSK